MEEKIERKSARLCSGTSSLSTARSSMGGWKGGRHPCTPYRKGSRQTAYLAVLTGDSRAKQSRDYREYLALLEQSDSIMSWKPPGLGIHLPGHAEPQTDCGTKTKVAGAIILGSFVPALLEEGRVCPEFLNTRSRLAGFLRCASALKSVVSNAGSAKVREANLVCRYPTCVWARA